MSKLLRSRFLFALLITLILAATGLSLRTQAQTQLPDCTVRTCAYLPLIEHNDQLSLPTFTPNNTATPTKTATRTPTPTTTSTATNGPIALSIRGSSSRQGTNYLLIGEVQNNGTQSAYAVTLTAYLYDRNHHLLRTVEDSAYLNRTAPGQTNPFKITISDPSLSIDNYTLSASSQNSSALDYQRLAVPIYTEQSGSELHIYGQVRNDNARELRNAKVVITFYDSVAVGVVDVAYDFPDSTILAPGATSPFTITMPGNLSYGPARVQGEGYLVP